MIYATKASYNVVRRTLITLMKGGEKEPVKKTDEETETKKRAPIGTFPIHDLTP